MSGSLLLFSTRTSPVPHKEGARSQPTVVSRPEQVTAHAKEIPNDAMYRQESLRMSDEFEPSHLSLALAGWLMRDCCSIVLLLRAVGTVSEKYPGIGADDLRSWKHVATEKLWPRSANLGV
jgi:hypothetical protein